MNKLDQHFRSLLSEQSRKAFEDCRCKRGKRKGLVLRNAPSMHDEPLAWAAWHGWQTGWGRWNAGTVGGLMIAPTEHKEAMREIWDEVSDAVIECRKILERAKK